MRYPWVNAALLVLLFFQFVTGFFGLISGSENLKWILWLHGIGGYAIAVILLWKTRIIFDALNRVHRINLFPVIAAITIDNVPDWCNDYPSFITWTREPRRDEPQKSSASTDQLHRARA